MIKMTCPALDTKLQPLLPISRATSLNRGQRYAGHSMVNWPSVLLGNPRFNAQAKASAEMELAT